MVQITIIGMGLIGTSLGMALRSADEKTAPLGSVKVIGFDQDKKALSDARGRLAIDVIANSLSDAVRGSQIVVIATPVGAIEGVMTQLGALLSENVVVTDVASTKANVVKLAEQYLPAGVDFVGGHPMAGKEQSGAMAAEPDLFKNAIYCLTPGKRARQHSIDIIEGLVNQVGAKPYYIEPAEHDAYVAGISHLPFLMSIALGEVTTRSPAWREMGPLASSGYRDTSRLASGNPVMHRDIALANRDAIVRWINDVARQLLEFRDQIQDGDGEKLLATFSRVKEQRDKWLDARPNLRPGELDFQGPQHEIERPNLFGRIGRRK